MKQPPISIPLAPSATSKWLGISAVAAAYALAVLMAVRPISSADIGYHLAYGERFFQSGHIVQGSDFVYPTLIPEANPSQANTNPGSWTDASGGYHFVNANWLSQIFMFWVYSIAGVGGLEVLQGALVAIIFALIVLLLHQARVPRPWMAICLLLAAMASYERFNLRPELFGYILLLGQACLLWRIVGATANRNAYKVGGIIALQLLAVNVHSYYWLAVGLAGAMWADALFRLTAAAILRRPQKRAATDNADAQSPDEARFPQQRGSVAPEQASVARGQFKWLSVTLAGCVLACFANPWFWRGAVMPFQTILFLRRYHIAGRTVTDSLQHPWAIIGELYGPFIPYLARSYASWAMYLLLGLASVAGVTAILRRQWGLLIVLASMAWAAMSVRRNIALLGMLVGPVAVIILWQAWQSVVQPALAKAQPKPKPLLPRLATGLSALALVAGLYWIHDVASQNFYQREWRPWEFGSGVSHLAVPVSAADWLTVHRPSGRVFTDLETSSNLMFFTQPHPEMPLLTNTWAMPPSIMEWAYRLATAQEDWRPAFDALDVQVVVLNSMFSRPLIKSLAHDGNWAVVSLDMKHVAFLRKNGPNAALAVGAAIRPDSLDVAALCRSLRAAEAVPSFAVTNAADLVLLLGWRPQAIEMWKESLRLRPDNYEVHNVVGHCLALQGCARLQAMVQLYQAGRDAQGDKLKDLAMEDWRQAKQHFEQALQIRPDYSQARHNLGLLQQDQEDFLQHRVPQYPDEDASPRVGVETMAF